MIVSGNGSTRAKWKIQNQAINNSRNEVYANTVNNLAGSRRKGRAIKDVNNTGMIVCDKSICEEEDIVAE